MKIHTYPKLDTWFDSLDYKAALEIQRVMKILRVERDQYGSNVFITPIKAFREANLDQNTYESILFNLDAHKIIEAVNTRSTSASNDPNLLSLSVDSIASNIRIIPPLFRYTLDLLQIKTGDFTDLKEGLSGESKLKLETIKMALPQRKQYDKHKKFITLIVKENGYISGYKLAQIVKPTIKSKRLSKQNYIDRKHYYNDKIRNLLKTLNPLLEQKGYKLKLKGMHWFLTSDDN